MDLELTGEMGEALDKGFEKISDILYETPGKIKSAWKGVIDRASTTAKQTAGEEALAAYHISKTDLFNKRYKGDVKIRTRETDEGVVGEIRYAGVKIPLMKFNVSPKKPTPKLNQHVKAAQLRGGTKKRFENAFVAKTRSGHLGMFERLPGQYMTDTRVKNSNGRRNKHTQKIGAAGNTISDQFYGASMPEMIGRTAVTEKIEEAVVDTIEKRTTAEITRILQGYGAK
jgi:hypothetical protein